MSTKEDWYVNSINGISYCKVVVKFNIFNGLKLDRKFA